MCGEPAVRRAVPTLEESAAVYTPKDYDLTAILADIVEIVERASREAA